MKQKTYANNDGGERGWIRVNHRNRGVIAERWDIENGGKQEMENHKHGLTTTFFIIEFGNKWRANDLYFEFKELGEIEEVVIPPRIDKYGRRYGFVCFVNVKDVTMLATKMDNIVFDGRKISANVPRFNREQADQKSANVKDGVKAVINGARGNFVYKKNNIGKGGRSYADALQNNEASGSKVADFNQKILSFTPNHEEVIQYRKAYSGRIKSPNVDVDFKKIFMDEGFFSIKVTFLGPNICLLEDLIDGEVEILVEEKKEWWEQWFCEYSTMVSYPNF